MEHVANLLNRFFLQDKNNKLYDSREDLYSIHTLFALHFVQLYKTSEYWLPIKYQDKTSELLVQFCVFFLCVNKILSIQTKNLKCWWNKITQ